MATSRSPEWSASALLFSGRPDPTWSVSEIVASELHAMWSSFGPSSGVPPTAPPLGYRGSILRAPDGREWKAFGGVVTLNTPEGVEVRSDTERTFERRLLDSAPPNLLPPLEFW